MAAKHEISVAKRQVKGTQSRLCKNGYEKETLR